MFSLTQPTSAAIAEALARDLAPATPKILSLCDGLSDRRLPTGFKHDFSQSDIGCDAGAFNRARQALSSWVHFDLGWARIANPQAAIAVDALVAVEVRAAGLWSLNISRIVETIDTPALFGFLYETTGMHAEEGQERFLLRRDPDSGAVTYLIEAISRPRHILARAAYPFTRAMQHRFARHSHRRLQQEVRPH